MPWQDVEFRSVCPHCGYRHDRASSPVTDDVPNDGDISFCVGCGNFSAFAHRAPGGLRKLTKKELRSVEADIRVRKMRSTWLARHD